MLIDPRTFRQVVRVREQLLANDDLGVADLAAQIGLSPARLIRVFAALFGTTPHQVRTQARSRYRKIVQVAAPANDPPLVPGCLGMLAWLPRNFREAPLC